MKFQSIAYSTTGSAHIYWILDLEGEVYSVYGICSQVACKNARQCFFRIWMGRVAIFGRVQRN